MLTPKQQAFCIEYVVDFNGQAAAERAGYSKRRARITASELLCNPEVSISIRSLIEERKSKADISAEKILQELQAVAFAKTTDFVKIKDVTVREGRKTRKIRVVYAELTSDLDEEKQRAISEIKQTKDGIGLKSHDKVKALELLGRHVGLFEKDNKQKAPLLNLSQLPVTFE